MVKPEAMGVRGVGLATPRLARHHAAFAKGGAALTTVSYASVSRDGRSFATQLMLGGAGLRAEARALQSLERYWRRRGCYSSTRRLPHWTPSPRPSCRTPSTRSVLGERRG